MTPLFPTRRSSDLGGSPAPNCIVAPVSSGRHSVSVQRMCTECFTYAPRAHSRTAYGASSMTFPHGCGDHHFLYLKKLFRGEAAGTLLNEDETRLTRGGWLRRNGERRSTRLTSSHECA